MGPIGSTGRVRCGCLDPTSPMHCDGGAACTCSLLPGPRSVPPFRLLLYARWTPVRAVASAPLRLWGSAPPSLTALVALPLVAPPETIPIRVGLPAYSVRRVIPQWNRPAATSGPEAGPATPGPALGDRVTRTGRVVPEQAVGSSSAGAAAGPRIPGGGRDVVVESHCMLVTHART